MDNLHGIELLLLKIKERHGSACTFTIKTYGEPYGTYIADDVQPCHRQHDTLEGAVERLQDFCDIDDLEQYNKDIAQQRLGELYSQAEDIENEIIRYNRILAGDDRFS